MGPPYNNNALNNSSDTEIIFNNSGELDGNAAFTFDDTAGAMCVELVNSQDGNLCYLSQNANAGADALAFFNTVTAGGAANFVMGSAGAGFDGTTIAAGALGHLASKSFVMEFTSNGLCLLSNGGTIEFYAGGLLTANLAMTIETDGSITFDATYTRHINIYAHAAVLGPNAPTNEVTGNAGGLGFDNDNEAAYINFEVGPDWDAASDMELEIIWSGESGDAIADTETVKFDISYYSIAEGQAVDNGTPVAASVTYTQSGAGTDKEMFESEITLDYDHSDQPIAVDDTIFIYVSRDVTGDSYSGKAIIYRWEVKFTANKMPYH